MAMWIPRTVEELEHAVESNSVTESHYLDFKEFTASNGVPRTVAKCVASLAVDGGVLILGVGEDKQAQRFVMKPTSLMGSRDAVDSVIANRVTPSLRVTVNVLNRGDGTGYLVVIVPPVHSSAAHGRWQVLRSERNGSRASLRPGGPSALAATRRPTRRS